MAMDKRLSIAALARTLVEQRSRRQKQDEAKALLQKKRSMSESAAFKYIEKEAERRGCDMESAAARIIQELTT